MKRFSGSTALVTGASRRIGKAIALKLAACGANVIVHYSESAKQAQDVVSQLKCSGVKSWKIRADFKRPAQIENMIDRANKIAGRVDLLINNASVFSDSYIETMEFDEFVRTLSINSFAPLVLSRDFAKQASHGSIINILDTRIETASPKHTSYQLSKDILKSITKIMALRYAPKIRINGIAPGLILPPPGKDVRFLKKLARKSLMKRYGSVDDVSNAVIYLLENDYITGEVIFVDGGQNITGGHYD
ncbi:SDR family oxidoreductase [Elusimicrobiota bacterium]